METMLQPYSYVIHTNHTRATQQMLDVQIMKKLSQLSVHEKVRYISCAPRYQAVVGGHCYMPPDGLESCTTKLS